MSTQTVKREVPQKTPPPLRHIYRLPAGTVAPLGAEALCGYRKKRAGDIQRPIGGGIDVCVLCLDEDARLRTAGR